MVETMIEMCNSILGNDVYGTQFRACIEEARANLNKALEIANRIDSEQDSLYRSK